MKYYQEMAAFNYKLPLSANTSRRIWDGSTSAVTVYYLKRVFKLFYHKI